MLKKGDKLREVYEIMNDPLAEQEQVDMASINAFVIMDGEKSGDNPTNGRHL